MISNQYIKKGSVLLSEQPFIYVLNSSLRTQHCDNCFRKGDLLKCSNCQYVYYCGKACQKQGWLVHKGECNNLKKIAPRVVPDAARFMARLIYKLNKGGNGVKSYYTRNKFRMFKDLMSHYPDLKSDERRMEHFTSLCGVLFEFVKDTFLPNTSELLGMYGRMCINSFNICDPETKTLGTGMYLAASILDHSCEPTAVATFDGVTIYVRSLKDMEYMDWTKVFISYIDILNKPKDRQNELEKHYYFHCKCPKCIDDSILEIMNSAACPSRDCNGYIDMRNIGINDIVKCGKCDSQLDEDFIIKYQEATEMNEMHIQNMNNLNYLDVCKVCIEKSKGVLYKLNIQYVKLLESSFESSIDLQQWTDAKVFGTQLIDGYILYYNEVNPLLGLLYMKLSKISFLFEERKEALNFLRKAFDILKITHGMDSPLFKTEIRPLMKQLTFEQSINGI